jgi:hypothetical protein
MITRLVRRWPLTSWWLAGLMLLGLMWQPYYYGTVVERTLWATDWFWGLWHLGPRLAVEPVLLHGRMQTIVTQMTGSALGLAIVFELDTLYTRWRSRRTTKGAEGAKGAAGAGNVFA